MHIVGTAGHVDHGKSSLIVSLTGHNPDRLPEERERAMTLDLGFAPLRFADGLEAGIIDVPGHEKFLHNMLAGAAGMELVLLVVSAAEGPMPQTYEHLHILNYLNVRRAIIVLTYADLVGADELDIASELAQDACRGTVAAGAPVFAVSNATGAGIERLRAAIRAALGGLPARDAEAPAYMPVDRIFVLRGHGTIVTGTLMQGTMRVGEHMTLAPAGLDVRVRGLQVFGTKMNEVRAGSRVAVNVAGVEAADMRRGDVLTAADAFEPTTALRVTFMPFTPALARLRKRTAVMAHIGAAQIVGRLSLRHGPPADARPQDATLQLSRPMTVYPGSHLVLRGLSPKALIGGAVAGFGSEAADGASAERRAANGASEAVYEALRRSGLIPLDVLKIAAAANMQTKAVEAAIGMLIVADRVVALTKPAQYLTRAAFDSAWQRVWDELQTNQERYPWRAGAGPGVVAAALSVDLPLAAHLLACWQTQRQVARHGGFWHLPGFQPVPTPGQRRFLDAVLCAAQTPSSTPKSYAVIAAAEKKAGAAGGLEALEALVLTGALVRIGDDVYTKEQIEAARRIVQEILAANGSATMSQLRDALGSSRKHALPLLEYFDGAGLTVRDGDRRKLRAR